MSDTLGIVGFWSAKRERNVFGIRGIGEKYDGLYKWLNDPKCTARSVSSDWPWDYVVFDDPFYEQSFLTLYFDDITFDKEVGYEYRALPPNLEPGGSIVDVEPKADRNFTDALAAVLSEEISRQIDAEILEQLLKVKQ